MAIRVPIHPQDAFRSAVTYERIKRLARGQQPQRGSTIPKTVPAPDRGHEETLASRDARMDIGLRGDFTVSHPGIRRPLSERMGGRPSLMVTEQSPQDEANLRTLFANQWHDRRRGQWPDTGEARKKAGAVNKGADKYFRDMDLITAARTGDRQPSAEERRARIAKLGQYETSNFPGRPELPHGRVPTKVPFPDMNVRSFDDAVNGNAPREIGPQEMRARQMYQNPTSNQTRTVPPSELEKRRRTLISGGR